jgi:hypothetical protein
MVMVLDEHWIRVYTSGMRTIPTAPLNEKAIPIAANPATMICFTTGPVRDNATTRWCRGS